LTVSVPGIRSGFLILKSI